MTILGFFTESVLFKYLSCLNISYMHFFHVNHEGIMNTDRANTVFEVLLHYLSLITLLTVCVTCHPLPVTRY